MKYKYQIVVHDHYYPSSILFEHFNEAEDYFRSIKGTYENNNALVTFCEIIKHKGNEPEQNEIDWYLNKENFND